MKLQGGGLLLQFGDVKHMVWCNVQLKLFTSRKERLVSSPVGPEPNNLCISVHSDEPS